VERNKNGVLVKGTNYLVKVKENKLSGKVERNKYVG